MGIGEMNEFDRTRLHNLLSVIQCSRNDYWLTMEGVSRGLITLLGYTEEEFAALFENRMLALVDADAREAVRRSLDEQLERGNVARVEFHMRHKDGRSVWVLGNAHRMMEADGNEYLYGMLIDISQIKADQEALRLSLERHQIVMDQTNDVIFEWDLQEDTLICSTKWEKRFGYPYITTDISTQLAQDSHLYPEDIELLREKMGRLKRGVRYEEVELRIADSSGQYLWNRLRATLLTDQEGKPRKVVGVIINIDAEKRSAQDLLERAERDPLTKLYNKGASRKQVQEYLTNRKPDERAALLIIDLDNFKQVNDQYGHMFGDVVLTQVAAELSGQFRSKDVVARIGGDEFMVFMKDIPNQTLVENRCERLRNTLGKVYEEQLTKCGFSCSIGIAFIPEHGTDFQSLFQRADAALYKAKGEGKSRYVCYNESAQLTAEFDALNEYIDWDEQSGLAENYLIYDVFRRLYHTNDGDEAIRDIMEMVGREMEVSRVYIFENSPDQKTCSNTYEWCNVGVPPQMDSLQNISYETDIAGYMEAFGEEGVYCVNTESAPEHIKQILARQGVKSVLQCAIYYDGVFSGFVGFDECSGKRKWTDEQLDLLKLLAQMLATFLRRERKQDPSGSWTEDLRALLDERYKALSTT